MVGVGLHRQISGARAVCRILCAPTHTQVIKITHIYVLLIPESRVIQRPHPILGWALAL